MARKSYANTGTDQPSPFEFQLEAGGRWWHCRPATQVPYGLWRGMSNQQEAASDSDAIVQMDSFFSGVLLPEEVDDFFEMVQSPKSPLTVDKLQPLMQDISEALANRPTGRSRRSSAGSPAKKGTSKGGSSSQGTRRARTA